MHTDIIAMNKNVPVAMDPSAPVEGW